MGAIKINKFGGMIPKLNDYQLPDHMATIATNTWLTAGVLEATRVPKLVRTCTNPTALSVFRIPKGNTGPDNIEDSYWLEFDYADVNVLRNPASDDSYERYYWCGELGIDPKYNTRTRIINGDAAYKIGIPAPSSAPTLSGVGAGTLVTRAYVVTYVSTFGEEGPPSAPVTGTYDSGSAWTVGLPIPTLADETDRSLATKRIYRTITSSAGVATYFQVAEVPKADVSYSDSLTDTVVSANNQLQSTFWSAPPQLEGWVDMPNGMVVGFVDKELWFCEPYRVHAWPATYTLTTAYPIVGLGVIGQTCIVCTERNTYAATGVNPAAVTMSSISETEPCTSRGSIVATPAGVLYSSTNGLMLATPASVTNVTDSFIGKQQWKAITNLQSMRAAALGTSYYTFGRWGGAVFEETAFETTAFVQDTGGNSTDGLQISFTETNFPVIGLSSDNLTSNVFNDPWTNEVLLLRTDGTSSWVYHLDVSEGRPTGTYTWRTKPFSAPKKMNFGVMKVEYENPSDVFNPSTTISIYADGRLVRQQALPASGVIFRLPSGFKAETWQFEFEGVAIIHDIHIASTARELANV